MVVMIIVFTLIFLLSITWLLLIALGIVTQTPQAALFGGRGVGVDSPTL